MSPHKPTRSQGIDGHPDETLTTLARCAEQAGFNVASPSPNLVRIIAASKGISVARDEHTRARAKQVARDTTGVTAERGQIIVSFGTKPDLTFVGLIRRCLAADGAA